MQENMQREEAVFLSDQLIILPTTVERLETFMNEIIVEFSLPNTDDTRDMIATMILHMPQTKVWATKRYFGEAVLKGMANKAAFEKLAEYKANREKLEEEKKATETTKEETMDAPSLHDQSI